MKVNIFNKFICKLPYVVVVCLCVFVKTRSFTMQFNAYYPTSSKMTNITTQHSNDAAVREAFLFAVLNKQCFSRVFGLITTIPQTRHNTYSFPQMQCKNTAVMSTFHFVQSQHRNNKNCQVYNMIAEAKIRKQSEMFSVA